MLKANRLACVLLISAAFPLVGVRAQAPQIVVQAASDAQPKTNAAAAVTAGQSSALETTFKALQEIRAANDEILKKQEATLQQLDDLQKAAEQIKNFTKRG